MFKDFFLFELKYRAVRPATYLYFLIWLLLSFMFVATDFVQIGGGAGKVFENSPYVIMQVMSILAAIGMLVTAAVMGVPIFRDFDHNSYSLLYTKPISKFGYLGGRFLGSYVTALFIFTAIPIGMILGSTIPWPWLDADKFLPFNAWHYIYNYLLFIVPSLFFSGALFFCVGALTRRMMMIYTQGVLLLVAYLISSDFVDKMDNKTLAALLDPFGMSAAQVVTEYWTVAEKNTLLLPFDGNFVWSRILWILVGVAFLAFTLWRFKLSAHQEGGFFSRKQKVVTAPNAIEQRPFISLNLPAVTQYFTIGTKIKQLGIFTWFYIKNIVKDVPFLAIALSGLAILVADANYIGEMYGTTVYPVTRIMAANVATEFMLFFIIILTFYSGELIWRERTLKIDQIYDALPVPNFVNIISKLLALVAVIASLCVVLIGVSMLLQAYHGYYNFEVGLYFSYYLFRIFPYLLMIAIFAIFVQVMVNNKFIGYALTIIFMIATPLLGTIGWEHYLYQYGLMPRGQYSDMNNFGHFVEPMSWFTFYWITFAGILLLSAVAFSVRGKETLLRLRTRVAKSQLTKPALGIGALLAVLFVSSGSYIYYNTNMLNDFKNSDAQNALLADYERKYKKYKGLPQPKITDVNLTVEIYPERRDFDAVGYYLITNKNDKPIDSLHVFKSSEANVTVTKLEVEKGADLVYEDKELKYDIYKLKAPLQPGETRKLSFELAFKTKGFVNRGSNTSVVENGTFFNTNYFPSFGYDENMEMTDDDDRKENNLPPKNDRMPLMTDSLAVQSSLLGDDADRVNFEIVLGTALDQIAVAPGYLQKEWEDKGRKYYHYKMDDPILNFWAIVSARYKVAKGVWTPKNEGRNARAASTQVDSVGQVSGDSLAIVVSPKPQEPVNIEIYYHEAHPYNIENMIYATKQSLDYFSTHFSPYQYRQMRILEFPAYATFAQSYANTVPYSEAIGFIARVKDPLEDIDYPFYVTAHEVAHQWWAHQVTEAPVQGNAMISETMAQYSALMVMKKEFGEAQMRKFLKFELESYLRGRSNETKKEMPLMLVESQGYIHYRKGAVIMYALQDYIGEDKVNTALAKCIQDWAYQGPPYITSVELIDYFKAETPDSLQYLYEDMFENITLFENRTTKATYTKIGEGQYKVKLNVTSKKLRADSLGVETEVPLHDWIDIGIFAKDDKESKGVRNPIYIQKHYISKGETEIEITVSEKPISAGIDPYNKLIDRFPDDNVELVEEDEVQ